MKIAVIGTGSVGGALGRRWAELGQEVTFGSREPGDKKNGELLAGTRGRATVASVSEAVAAAEVVVLATPWSAVPEVLASAGDLAGKIVIDATNPLKPDLSGLDVPPGRSGAQEVARLASGARVYKALNQTGWENMADPAFPGGRPVIFVAGDEPGGKATVLSLVQELGFEAIDAGDLSEAPLLESLAVLWIHLMVHRNLGRRFAFSLLRKEG